MNERRKIAIMMRGFFGVPHIIEEVSFVIVFFKVHARIYSVFPARNMDHGRLTGLSLTRVRCVPALKNVCNHSSPSYNYPSRRTSILQARSQRKGRKVRYPSLLAFPNSLPVPQIRVRKVQNRPSSLSPFSTKRKNER